MGAIKKYKVAYACATTVGRLRKNNEDNYYAGLRYRTDLYAIEDELITGELLSSDNDMVAVFDGMGGEACGEIAAMVAASCCEQFCRDKAGYDEYLYELAEMLNEKVREDCEARSLVLMGTTCAMIQFGKSDIYVVNAGDSRVYKLSSHELRQVSEDHCMRGYHGKALTKFLGMPGEGKLMPYIAMGSYKAGDMFLLCTDGITDMLKDEEILAIADSGAEPERIARELIEQAMTRGGYDNATVMVCKINKHR